MIANKKNFKKNKILQMHKKMHLQETYLIFKTPFAVLPL